MAETQDDMDRWHHIDLRTELRRLAHKSRPGDVARQVEGTRKLIEESHQLLAWIKTLRLI